MTHSFLSAAGAHASDDFCKPGQHTRLTGTLKINLIMIVIKIKLCGLLDIPAAFLYVSNISIYDIGTTNSEKQVFSLYIVCFSTLSTYFSTVLFGVFMYNYSSVSL